MACVGVGFVRGCVVAVASMLVPAVWAAAAGLGIWWWRETRGRGWRRPCWWTGEARVVRPGLPDGPLPRREMDRHRHPCRIPAGRAGDADVHRLLAERLLLRAQPPGRPPGQEEAGPVESPSQLARPAVHGDMPLTGGVVAALPSAGVAAAALGLGRPGLATRLAGRSAWSWPSPPPRTLGGSSS